MNVIKVASRSRTSLVAGAIAGVYRENGNAEVQAIGAGAVNQAIKAVAIAKGYLAEEGISIVFVPSFVEIEIEGQERTAVRLSVENRTLPQKKQDGDIAAPIKLELHPHVS
ncbi:MAG: stage V sporulation protein S [Chloroflexi bacterium]|nr:MAG: stage V sporulation protein S [Chloroflexota bacterium]